MFLFPSCRSDDVQSETAQVTNEGEAAAAESSQPPAEAAASLVDDGGLSMPAFDDVVAEPPTVTETEPMTAQDMPDQVSSRERLLIYRRGSNGAARVND